MRFAFYTLNMVWLTQPKTILSSATTFRRNKCVKRLTVSQKKPITPHFLLAFKSHLNLDKPLHATFWAVCQVTHFGLLRKANLQCIGFTQFDPSKHLRGGDILFFTDWASIINRWSNTIQFSQRFLTVPLPRIHPSIHSALIQLSDMPFAWYQHLYRVQPPSQHQLRKAWLLWLMESLTPF